MTLTMMILAASITPGILIAALGLVALLRERRDDHGDIIHEVRFDPRPGVVNQNAA